MKQAQLAANAADEVEKQAAESVVRSTAEAGTGIASNEQAGRRGWGGAQLWTGAGQANESPDNDHFQEHVSANRLSSQ